MSVARALLLGGGYAAVSVISYAFQSPPPQGSESMAYVIGENVVKLQGNTLSLPELTRTPGFEGSIFFNFVSRTITNTRIDDGGRRLSPGFSGHSFRMDGNLYNATFDFAATKIGHWLPVPAGSYTEIEILNRETGGVAWHGVVRCDTQISPDSVAHLSLSQLRASVEFDRGMAHIIIPATDTSSAVTILSTLLCGVYLIGIAAVCGEIDMENASIEDVVGKDGPAYSGLRLFLLDSSLNGIGVCVSSLLLSYSLLQTLRTGIALVGSVWASAATLFMLTTKRGSQWRASTMRCMIETSLLSGISVALGVYSPIASFSAIVFSIGIIGVCLRDFGLPDKEEYRINYYVDLGFKIYVLLVGDTRQTSLRPSQSSHGRVSLRGFKASPLKMYSLFQTPKFIDQVWTPAIFTPSIYSSLVHYQSVVVSVMASTG